MPSGKINVIIFEDEKCSLPCPLGPLPVAHHQVSPWCLDHRLSQSRWLANWWVRDWVCEWASVSPSINEGVSSRVSLPSPPPLPHPQGHLLGSWEGQEDWKQCSCLQI